MARVTVPSVVQRAVTRLHAWVYAASGGRVGARMRGFDVVLLTTRGRKTGRQRTTPLAGMRDGDDLFVIASNGGRPYHPAWFLNLRADPRVRLRVGNRITEVLSEIVPPAERERLWQMVIRRYPFYAGYQSSSRREIPLIRLRPQRM